MEEQASTTETIVADRFSVDLSRPLPEFDTVGGTAYAATDIVSKDRSIYALVQRRGVPRRETVVGKLIGRAIPNLSCPRGDGLITATDQDGHGQRIVTIVDRPAGGRLISNPSGFSPFLDRVVREEILPPLLSAIAALEGRGVAHRGICLRNLYVAGGGDRDIMLGECFSAPPGYHNVAGYELIERSSALPEGRGEGDSRCDMYALGVTILSLLLGRDVAEAADNENLLATRINKGSYMALSNGSELGGSITDLVRGLLEDNPSKRWTAADVHGWLDGDIPKSAVADMGWSLDRTITLKDRSYKDRRALAVAMQNNPGAAVQLVRQEKFIHTAEQALAEGQTADWLKRALDDREGMNTGSEGGLAENMMLARISAVLFPEGPICFGRTRVCPDGFGPALAMAFTRGEDGALRDYIQLLDASRLLTILGILNGRARSQGSAVSRLSGVMRHAGSSQLGLGIERALYELNKSLPCQSPKVRDIHVDSLRKLLVGLDKAAETSDIGVSMVDKHIGAFIARHADAFELSLSNLDAAAGRQEAYLFQTLKLLGALQQKYCPRPLKSLAAIFKPSLKKAVEELKSKRRRKQVLEAVNALLEQGNLARIANELNLSALRGRDQREFAQAKQYHARLTQTLRRLEIPFAPQQPRMRAIGHKYAAVASVIILLLVTSLALTKGGVGV